MSDDDAQPDVHAGEVRAVDLLGVPLRLAVRSAEHHATLMRELALVAASDDTSTAHGRLLTLAPELRLKYARLVQPQRARAVEAAKAGAPTVDLRFDVPMELADDAARVAELLGEVDEFCREGELMTLVTPSDIAEYRNWILSQFQAQLRESAEPSPWTGSTEEPRRDITDSASRPGMFVVDEDLDLEGASRARDEIAALLEQGVTELVIDVARCEFMDSVGISLLLTTLARLRDVGGSLRLVNPTDAVRRTLRHAGIVDLLVHD